MKPQDVEIEFEKWFAQEGPGMRLAIDSELLQRAFKAFSHHAFIHAWVTAANKVLDQVAPK